MGDGVISADDQCVSEIWYTPTYCTDTLRGALALVGDAVCPARGISPIPNMRRHCGMGSEVGCDTWWTLPKN